MSLRGCRPYSQTRASRTRRHLSLTAARPISESRSAETFRPRAMPPNRERWIRKSSDGFFFLLARWSTASSGRQMTRLGWRALAIVFGPFRTAHFLVVEGKCFVRNDHNFCRLIGLRSSSTSCGVASRLHRRRGSPRRRPQAWRVRMPRLVGWSSSGCSVTTLTGVALLGICLGRAVDRRQLCVGLPLIDLGGIDNCDGIAT
jgi:hypothetical protein